MPRRPLSLRLKGATVLRDGEMQKRSLVIQQGRISKGPLPEVDLTGYLLLPGIIDMHGDAFERHIAPRPSAPFPLETGLRATDRDAAVNGVTTAWLAQSWSWEGGHRGPDFAEKLLTGLDHYRSHALSDLRIQIRCETHTVDTAERLLSAVERHKIDYVVFNNHLDEALHLARLRPEEITLWAKKAGRTPKEHMALVHAAQEQTSRVPRYLCKLAERFDQLGVRYGSHDDPDGDTRERFSMIGAKICEFPTARPAAALAKAVGDHVVMGAPNIVRGGSQSGNIAASDLVEARLCDALVSDYYYPALAQSAFRLVDDGIMTLPKAWKMISETPARIMGLADRGHFDFGRRADVAIVNAKTRAIEGTISGGRITHLVGEAAHRFFYSSASMQLAAE
ncbi:alpha-D-ribose 1-methylphosphonate 5-triphosphate diphosphatase [Shimia sp. CNT1-13L.2]|uniref:alpha-D-ribose 1-methylphosphonate 5-triphosphate diphosphatase n=1 Tax=Shimia sp. CNT1-13L.2 TaxID=2959663 RepID=UPI0020CE7A1B|nr:alpha-D-ribose 1-methylphosphonate 5-triphosphate diphosphatase [Shimia sp. CNT1-13L.2]MCP9482799.1 alpha-D-ribose 1-methylphosphonate 5-triphosphate diphosphatase [Shimia sp. CNT1-13L.2]